MGTSSQDGDTRGEERDQGRREPLPLPALLPPAWPLGGPAFSLGSVGETKARLISCWLHPGCEGRALGRGRRGDRHPNVAGWEGQETQLATWGRWEAEKASNATSSLAPPPPGRLPDALAGSGGPQGRQGPGSGLLPGARAQPSPGPDGHRGSGGPAPPGVQRARPASGPAIRPPHSSAG